MIRVPLIGAALLALLLAGPAAAEEIVAGLSQNRVSITADFDGSEILIYGAVKRDAPAPEGRLEVIITVEGPKTPLIIRKKSQIAGIWINRDQVKIDAAPSFYAVATTGPLVEILSDTDDLRHTITLPRVIRAVGISAEAANSPDFVDALLRVRQTEDRFRVMEGMVQFTEATLFRTDVVLPANLTEGQYTVRMFLTRAGHVVAEQERVIGVRKEGLERLIFTMATEQPLAYGLVSLLFAVVAGWGASAAFRLIRL